MRATDPNTILASSSVYRRELLARLGFAFRCQVADIDEAPLENETPREVTIRLATEKAQSVACNLESGLVIGSDQVADRNDQLLGKPGDPETARQQLLACSGKQIRFYTAVSVVNAANSTIRQLLDTTTVKFRLLSEETVDRYIRRESALDCAGGFKSEGLGITLFEVIESDDPTALIGLPLISLTKLLRAEGIDLP